MNLTYLEDHKSIKFFKPIELPNLTILIGLNGSGKTHLLESIINGKSQIDAISINEVVYFQNSAFALDQESQSSHEQIKNEKKESWRLFWDQYKSSINSFKNNIIGQDYSEVVNICKTTSKNLGI